MALLALAAFVAVTQASPPSGVTPTVLARGTYDAFKVKSPHDSPVELQGQGEVAGRLRRATTRLRGRGYTGWHTHPGPVFITVTQGELTYYDYDDPTCTPHVVTAGHGFVDNGTGHIVRNESGADRAGRERDHRAGGRSVPRRARPAESELRLLTL